MKCRIASAFVQVSAQPRRRVSDMANTRIRQLERSQKSSDLAFLECSSNRPHQLCGCRRIGINDLALWAKLRTFGELRSPAAAATLTPSDSAACHTYCIHECSLSLMDCTLYPATRRLL